MSDATKTADILAAWQLIEEHGLSVTILDNDMWRCAAGDRSVAPTWVAAVRSWAESAGVPWPAVKVVPMWVVVDSAAGASAAYYNRVSADIDRDSDGGQVVPCEVVIRETEGV